MPYLYRCENKNLKPPPPKPQPKPPSPPPPPPKKKGPPKKKKLSFKTCKKNTINSLNEVEHFLRNFQGFMKYIKLYKILK